MTEYRHIINNMGLLVRVDALGGAGVHIIALVDVTLRKRGPNAD